MSGLPGRIIRLAVIGLQVPFRRRRPSEQIKMQGQLVTADKARTSNISTGDENKNDSKKKDGERGSVPICSYAVHKEKQDVAIEASVNADTERITTSGEEAALEG